ncbi:dienelactone hydrolase family protein [Thalassovita taeanensis]|uniref:Dienelactone hydrolase n=1 Tax=Thalassovita taeanensis TaxID=657014 RepID=A0A1H9GFW1_9RHOB|nr:alpha/beta family hydrolase [Thalassovita taeanensis]SEQ48708.1 Dienelactone hydrolase [Thalassovita taeanensis]
MSIFVSRKRTVSVGSKGLEGFLRLPPEPLGLVIFAHGAGSSHLSVRNNFVAEELEKRAIATLLFDLLTEEETQDRSNVFDIKLLSTRMIDAISWAQANLDIPALPIGLFGASTGAAAALVAAARAPSHVVAVVSRGGRPDLADDALARVHAPVLLIVGGDDYQVIGLNEAAAERLTCTWKLEIVPGATHLFEEPGTLEQVVNLAGTWFEEHFTQAERGS